MTANPYARLVELARIEHRLVGEGRWDELQQLDEERRVLVASLPAVPPADARDHLLEAERIVQRTMQFCGLALADMRAHMSRLQSRVPALNSHA
jgi:hypothetical protein